MIESLPRTPTNIPGLDDLLDGGIVPGQIVAIHGPKPRINTMLAKQIGRDKKTVYLPVKPRITKRQFNVLIHALHNAIKSGIERIIVDGLEDAKFYATKDKTSTIGASLTFLLPELHNAICETKATVIFTAQKPVLITGYFACQRLSCTVVENVGVTITVTKNLFGNYGEDCKVSVIATPIGMHAQNLPVWQEIPDNEVPTLSFQMQNRTKQE